MIFQLQYIPKFHFRSNITIYGAQNTASTLTGRFPSFHNLMDQRQDQLAKQDGIFIQIKRDISYPCDNYVWTKDKPTRRREKIYYTECISGRTFSVQIKFLPGQIKFDPSIHFKVTINFEGMTVWTENVTAEQITDGWEKTITKPNRGERKNKDSEFFFDPVRPPSTMDLEALENQVKSDQGTVSVRFYRLKVLGEFKPRGAKGEEAALEEGTVGANPKIYMRDPTRRLSDRPGIRSKAKGWDPGAGTFKPRKLNYRQEDEDINPYYVFDFKIRSGELLRELKIIRPTREDVRQRKDRAKGVNRNQISQLGIGDGDDNEDEVIFLGEVRNGIVYISDDEHGGTQTAQRKSPDQATRCRQAGSAGKTVTTEADRSFFLDDNADDDDDDDDEEEGSGHRDSSIELMNEWMSRISPGEFAERFARSGREQGSGDGHPQSAAESANQSKKRGRQGPVPESKKKRRKAN